MDRAHEPGCDGNHTGRQRCNGQPSPSAEPPTTQESATRAPYVSREPESISRSRLIGAVIVEFLPIFAVLAMIGFGWLMYVADPPTELVGLIPSLLFLLVFIGSGVGWFLAGVPIGGCAALFVRLCASLIVFAAFVRWFDLGNCDADYDPECEHPSSTLLLSTLALWMLLTPLSAALLFVTQRSRITRSGAADNPTRVAAS